jgi:hypothetical protein
MSWMKIKSMIGYRTTMICNAFPMHEDDGLSLAFLVLLFGTLC